MPTDGSLQTAIRLHQAGQLAEAEQGYRRVLARDPRSVDALHYLGVIAHQSGQHAEALTLINRAIEVRGDQPVSWSNRGIVLQALRRPEEAIASYDRALALKANYPEAHFNRGNALREVYRVDEALASYAKALSLKPDYFDVWFNRGALLRGLNRPVDALENYARALELKPDFPAAHFNSSQCHLLLGNFAAGLPVFEWRWQDEQLRDGQRNLGRAQWQGEPLAGKTILLHAEQGIGDTLQFCRYAPLVQGRGGRVLLEVQPALLPLLGSLRGADWLIGRGERLPDFDVQCPLLSLPLALQTTAATIPATVPYLRAPEDQIALWHARLGRRIRPRIGIAWAGNPGHRNDHHRSLPLASLAPLWAAPVEWHSLQVELRPADARPLEALPALQRHEPLLTDFAATAALIEHLDLVITVDTAIAHLAGALGKPVWILLPFAPDWRWQLERNDSPWYPTARLYRQPGLRDWGTVVSRIGAALTEISGKAG